MGELERVPEKPEAGGKVPEKARLSGSRVSCTLHWLPGLRGTIASQGHPKPLL